MTLSIGRLTSVVTAILLASFLPGSPARAQQDARPIANNSGIFIDGMNFQITERTSKSDVARQIERLGARELGAGAIIFRVGDRLYLAGAGTEPRRPPVARADPGIARQRGDRGGPNVGQQRAYVYDPAAGRRVVYDADYANWRLNRIFQELVGTSARK